MCYVLVKLIHSSLDSDDDFRSGCRNVSQTVITNSPSQDYTHPDDHNLPTYEASLSPPPWAAPWAFEFWGYWFFKSPLRALSRVFEE